jgi:hypothetical protein
VEYRPKNDAEKRAALDKLLARRWWRSPYTDTDRAFLAGQIK